MRIIDVVMLMSLFSSVAASQPAPQEPGINQRIWVTAAAYDDGWRTLLKGPTSAFFDKNSEELLVADTGNNRILIYDKELNPKYAFEHFVREPKTGVRMKGEPRAVVANSIGDLIVIDNMVNYLDVLDFRGRRLLEIELNLLVGDPSIIVKPQCLAIDQKDWLYVGTGGDLVTILVLNSDFELVRMVGTKGGGEADFNAPLAIHVHGDRLYVADMYAVPAIKVFDANGRFLYGFGGHGIERTGMSFPTGLTVLESSVGERSIWITDGLRQVVKVFEESGEFLAHVGGFGINSGELRYPSGIASANDGFIYVTERIGNRIQRFELR